MEKRLICDSCKEELREMEVQFSYMGKNMTSVAPRCPKCGQIYIPETMASGKMRELEEALEDK